MNRSQIDAAISAKIIAEVQKGATIRQAIDAVLGAGTFSRMAGDLYDALRAKNDAAKRASQVADAAIARAKRAAAV